MAQESPAGADVLDAYRKRAAERKGRHNIDALDTTKGSGARADKGLTGPSSKSKKRSREGGNIATTTRSPGSLLTPPPHRDMVEVDSLSPKRATKAVDPPETEGTMEASMLPLALLGVTYSSLGGVCLALPEATREVIRVVPSSNLLRGGLEMLCRSVVMIQLGSQERDRHVE